MAGYDVDAGAQIQKQQLADMKTYDIPTRAFDPLGSLEELKEVFIYHPPTLDQQRQYSSIRAGALVLAEQLMAIPPCADRSAAFRLLRECVMTANAAVALRAKI